MPRLVCGLHCQAGVSKLGLVLLLASGCVTFDPIGPDDPPEPPKPPGGDGSNGSGSTIEAREAFTKEVHPILSQQCGTCHTEGGPGGAVGWFRDDPDETYDTLLTTHASLLGEPRFSAAAPLITAPQRLGLGFYTPEQIERILRWFELELR